MPMLSAANPSQSNGSRASPSVSSMKARSPMTVATPNGRLMKKIHRQE